MTTMAALFGALPLMLASGDGGSNCASRSASAIVGGLIVCQLLTLFTTPVIYLGLRPAGAAAWPRRRDTARRGGAPEGSAAMNLSPTGSSARPVATTLLTLGIALTGVAAFFVLPDRLAAARWTFRPISVQRQPARRQPRDDGLQRRHPARAAARRRSPTSPR